MRSTPTTSAASSRARKGPEAGVWVIAETTELPTKFARIVVTDDRGRYVIPDLPKANYNVWVRGYGLVDSPKVQTAPGKTVEPDRGRRAQRRARRRSTIRPATGSRCCSVPDKSEFPAPARRQRHLAEHESQAEWLRDAEVGRLLGVPPARQQGDARDAAERSAPSRSSAAAWERRIQSGQAGAQMISGLNQLGRERALAMFADWTDRIAAGEVPPAPPRPQGIERNVVITQWDWADPEGLPARRGLDRPAQSDRSTPTA